MHFSPEQIDSAVSAVHTALQAYEASRPAHRLDHAEGAAHESLLIFIRHLLESDRRLGRLDPAYDLGGRAYVIKVAVADYLEEHRNQLDPDQIAALLAVYERVENHDLDQIEADGIQAGIAPSVHSILEVRRNRLTAFRRRWESVGR